MKLISRSLVGFFSALAVASAIIAVFHLTSWGKDTGPAVKVDTTTIERSPQLGTSFAPVVKKAAPSVVNIYSTTIVHKRLFPNPFFNDPMFRQFFGDQFRPNDDREITRRQQSLGSGVIISPDGYILTANHVVKGAVEIKVAIGDNDSKKFTAKVVGTDPPTDVAVLKIDAKDLPAITLGDSDQLEIGDMVLAIGDPFGVGQTVTMGIVSGLGRSGLSGFNQYQDFIQTDAAINPGNSGGALVDAEGRLVGINTGIIPNENGGNQGIGFAVPINMARHVVERLIAGGRVTRGYIGILPEDITPGLAEAFHLPNQTGALVDEVEPETPAQKAGIKSGDVIIEINGKKINDANSLRLMISEMAPGTSATVKLLRNGQEKTVSFALAELPDKTADNGNDGKNSGADNSRMDTLEGVTVADLDQQARQQLQLPDNIQGVVVTEVGPDSNSAEAGLQPNDVIVEINHQPVKDANTAVKLCTQAKGNWILLKIWRRIGNMAVTRYLSVDNTANAK
ncbi:MAG: DegQ family serine endoprotease [Verrucomicrobiota bacterium]|jgi:serine protease Do